MLTMPLHLGRSRARRKEYLQELEAKLRSCEQLGIEASAEIQSAARKVLEENKKLRVLLRERGVPEAEIVAVMGGSNDKPFEHMSAAPSLNSMLERKIACHIPSSIDSDIESPPSMYSSSASMAPRGPAVPPITIPRHRASTLNETPSPRSIVSSTGTPPGFSANPFFHHASMTPEVKPQNMPQYDYQYAQPINNAWTYQNEAPYTSQPVPYYNTSSCVDAANIIRTMRSDVGLELENDLGCPPHDQNCYVDNSLVFNMMEKYSDPRSGI
jgi:hypothetical protein